MSGSASIFTKPLFFQSLQNSKTKKRHSHFISAPPVAVGGDGWCRLVLPMTCQTIFPVTNSHLDSNPNSNLFDPLLAAQTQSFTSQTFPTNGDDISCSSKVATPQSEIESTPNEYLTGDAHIKGTWAHWQNLGSPKFIVAPMVDHSELPFRLLCRKYGAQAAYTPMLHSRVFNENPNYRSREFTTCKEDRPLFVQFCANDPNVLLEAARRVESYCDYVDINLGCPQNFAKRGNYGAFLMTNLPLVKSLVENLSKNLNVPVSCKIRIFPDLQDTIHYAKMLEDAGCSLLAVHGRTRDEKDQKKFRANWNVIKEVKNAVRIPVLANGNIRHIDDVWQCLEETGVEGVLSAESILENPALFAGYQSAEWVLSNGEMIKDGKLDQGDLLVEYLKLCEKYPVSWGIIISHVHKMLGEWFRIQPSVRDDLNAQKKVTFEYLYEMVARLRELGVKMPLYVSDSNLSRLTCSVK